MIGYRSAGDAALLLVTDTHQDGNVAARLAAAIRAADPAGVIDVVPGASTVLVSFEPGVRRAGELAAELTRLPPQPTAAQAAGAVEFDVVYDGPDLAQVAALTGLSVSEVIARHQAAFYRVGWLGFSPGFGYLTGLDRALAAVPRRDSPRVAVPAGSVAIAGGLAAVYPAASPGGWQLLGRIAAPTATALAKRLWDPAADPPALLVPGMTVRFRAVRTGTSRRPPESNSRPGPPAGGPQPARSPSAATLPATAAGVPPNAPAGATPANRGPDLIEVLQPGPLTTVQDLGRAGFAHLGVPGSGAADLASLRQANRLAGNDDGAACLEITLGRLALRFGRDATIALTGAAAPIRLTTAGGEDQPAPPGAAVAVTAGTVLRLGAPAAGLRSYLAIDGGFDAEPVLGSRSADLLSGLGPAPLRPGDWLRAGRPRSGKENAGLQRPWPGSEPPPRPAGPGGLTVLRAITGPRDDWFGADAVRALSTSSFLVTPASNRTGLRLDGQALRRVRAGELPSEGMAAGSLQVTHDGHPILLLADHPVTGGYPVIAVVVSADIGLAAQLRPGQQVRFSLSPPAPGTR